LIPCALLAPILSLLARSPNLAGLRVWRRAPQPQHCAVRPGPAPSARRGGQTQDQGPSGLLPLIYPPNPHCLTSPPPRLIRRPDPDTSLDGGGRSGTGALRCRPWSPPRWTFCTAHALCRPPGALRAVPPPTWHPLESGPDAGRWRIRLVSPAVGPESSGCDVECVYGCEVPRAR
jgi:hypothetical protein